MTTRLQSVSLSALIALLILPAIASAQSAIVGTVRDTSGAVLPGVTLEATSPALIEGTRSTTTDGRGQYRFVDLRPGTYTVLSLLPGFAPVERTGILLQAEFTASVNIEMDVGGVEETVTVSGVSPLVDVSATANREVMTRDLLETLPTSRTFLSAGSTLPAVNQGQVDVGGSAGNQQGVLSAYGGRGLDMAMEMDGMNVMSAFQTGWIPSHYHNQGEFQEITYTVAGGPADSQTPGIKVNLIPKEGGNVWTAGASVNYATGAWQTNNLDSDLIGRGYKSITRLDRAWDVNPDFGGPIIRDKMWLFFSYRNWAYNQVIGNIFWRDLATNPCGGGSDCPGLESNLNQAYSTRITTRLSDGNKLNFAYNHYPRTVDTRGILSGTVLPEATVIATNPEPYIVQAKWTSTPSSKVLIEFGGLYHNFNNVRRPQDGVRLATCFVAFADCPSGTNYGDIHHYDAITGLSSIAPTSIDGGYFNPTYNVVGSLSYITGSHALKVGGTATWGGFRGHLSSANGQIRQRYRNGVADSVDVTNGPTKSRQDVNRDVALFIMDSWRLGRLTLNPGVRFEYFRASNGAVDLPAGRFVPVRHFDAGPALADWKNVVPRFGAAFDLFGDGRTAIKASFGKYMQPEKTSFVGRYNPAVSSRDRRTWSDTNGDDIAQESELGPTTNKNFGIRANRNPDPNIKRPFQLIYNAGLQHEMSDGLSVSLDYYRRTFHQIIYTKNLVAPNFATDYTQVSIADPRLNGETITVYNLNAALVGLVDQLDINSPNNSRSFDAIDLTFDVRFLDNLSLNTGFSTGKLRASTCDVADPNLLRTCETNFPWRTQFKLTGTYALPGQFQLSGTFVTLPAIVDSRVASKDGDIGQIYKVNRKIVPSLNVPQVQIQLNQPGTIFLDRINQLDISLSRAIQIGNLRLRPMLDVFNALNVNPVLKVTDTFGSSFNKPRVVMPGRLLRFGARIDF